MAFRNFSWVIDHKLAGSDIPGNSLHPGVNHLIADIEYLNREGIRTVISLTPMPRNFGTLCKNNNLTWLEYYIPDYGVPSNGETFKQLVFQCKTLMDGGLPVCIHCQAGVGRTGLVLACVVGSYLSLDVVEAIRFVRSNRPAIETEEQMAFIENFLSADSEKNTMT